jgi:hypothetical protein
MKERMPFFRSLLIAMTTLALSAGLAFGAAPQASWGLENAAAHAGKTVPVAGGAEDLGDDEETTDEETTDEETEEPEDSDEPEEDEEEGVESEEAGENCATDPSALTGEELGELKHGSIVCWAAHQTEWPAWFDGHGPFVKCWAHHGKADAASCTEDPNADEGDEETVDEGTGDDAAAPLRGKGNGKGKAKSKNH